jgi:hypothetical protein
MKGSVVAAVVLLLLTGCAASKRASAQSPGDVSTASARSDAVDPDAQASALASVSSRDFDALWKACERSLWARHFRIDRRDYREGLITTYPLISKQFFEPWRTDTLGAANVAESSLNTIRRTVRFEIAHDSKRDVYTAVPRVQIERYSNAGRRLTSAAMYRSTFRRTEARGTRESDAGVTMPSRYWYSIGHDERLEQALARSVKNRLR